MDVLSPDLMWIDGRCYRVPTLDSTFSSADIVRFRDCDLEEEYGDMIQCGDIVDIPDIEVIENGRHKMVFSVARAFLPFIIGSKGATIKRISKDTSCNIRTPKFSEEQNITIFGPSRDRVILAWKNILFIITSCRRKLAVTHFISIPMTGKEIQENFREFKEKVLLTCNGEGISEDLFQVPEKLHLSLVLLILTDDKERKLAEEKLFEVCNGHIRKMIDKNKPCIIEVRGINYFNDDPSKICVLFANVKIKNNENLFQDICDKLNHDFKELELVKKETKDAVKIHLTLMNTSFLDTKKDELDSADKSQKTNKFEKITFDASNIFKKYKDFYFGEQELKCIHLSTRFTVDKDGYYKHAAKVEF